MVLSILTTKYFVNEQLDDFCLYNDVSVQESRSMRILSCNCHLNCSRIVCMERWWLARRTVETLNSKKSGDRGFFSRWFFDRTIPCWNRVTSSFQHWQFWLEIHGYFHRQKTTMRLGLSHNHVLVVTNPEPASPFPWRTCRRTGNNFDPIWIHDLISLENR